MIIPHMHVILLCEWSSNILRFEIHQLNNKIAIQIDKINNNITCTHKFFYSNYSYVHNSQSTIKNMCMKKLIANGIIILLAFGMHRPMVHKE